MGQGTQSVCCYGKCREGGDLCFPDVAEGRCFFCLQRCFKTGKPVCFATSFYSKSVRGPNKSVKGAENYSGREVDVAFMIVSGLTGNFDVKMMSRGGGGWFFPKPKKVAPLSYMGGEGFRVFPRPTPLRERLARETGFCGSVQINSPFCARRKSQKI